jgi:hypothetical protein
MSQNRRDGISFAELSKVRRVWKLGRAGAGTVAAAMGIAAALTLLAFRLPGQPAIHWLVPIALAAVLVAGVVAAKRGHLADAAVVLTPLATATLVLQWFIASLTSQEMLASTTFYGGTYDSALALAAEHLSVAVPCLAGALLALATAIVLGLGRVVVPASSPG